MSPILKYIIKNVITNEIVYVKDVAKAIPIKPIFAVVGAVTYFCGMYVLKVEEISMILQQIKKKLYTNDDRRNNQ